jgi:hypothetical protein
MAFSVGEGSAPDEDVTEWAVETAGVEPVVAEAGMDVTVTVCVAGDDVELFVSDSAPLVTRILREKGLLPARGNKLTPLLLSHPRPFPEV